MTVWNMSTLSVHIFRLKEKKRVIRHPDAVTIETGSGKVSVLKSLCKTFGPTFLKGSLLKLIQDALAFVNPQILR